MPALGRPASAASARSLRCSSSSASSPGRPVSANLGVCRDGVANWALPRPPCPPRATTTRVPERTRSATSCPSGESTCVPTGTCSSASSPSAPCLRVPRPFPPRPALKRVIDRKLERSRRSAPATSTTSPPSPPSPPSGPPFGTYFSRRKESPPSPPRPACTWMSARSANSDRGRGAASRVRSLSVTTSPYPPPGRKRQVVTSGLSAVPRWLGDDRRAVSRRRR